MRGRRLLFGYFLMNSAAACSLASPPFALLIFSAASRSPLETFASACVLLLSCAAALNAPAHADAASQHAQTSAHAERVLNFISLAPQFNDDFYPTPKPLPDRLHQNEALM